MKPSNVTFIPCASCDDVYYTINCINEDNKWREVGDIGTFKVHIGYNYFTPYNNQTFTATANFSFIDLSINTSDTLPPNQPTNPSPSNDATDVNTTSTLKVTVSDPDGDFMDVSFYDSFDTFIGQNTNVQSGDTGEVNWSGLSNGTTYSWYVIVTDTIKETRSDSWSFTTHGIVLLTVPEVTGSTTGSQNNMYNYTARSISIDNNTIQYIFNWDDGESTTTTFLPNGTTTTQTHSWTSAGKYIITVKAFDNFTYSATKRYIVLIDAKEIDGIGYITDNNADGIYDIFHNDTTSGENQVEQLDDGTYLIDENNDEIWDYVYNSETEDLIDYMEKEQVILESYILIIGGMLVVLLFIIISIGLIKKK